MLLLLESEAGLLLWELLGLGLLVPPLDPPLGALPEAGLPLLLPPLLGLLPPAPEAGDADDEGLGEAEDPAPGLIDEAGIGMLSK